MNFKRVIASILVVCFLMSSLVLVNVAEDPVGSAEIAGHTLALTDNIRITYYVDVKIAAEDGYEIVLGVWKRGAYSNLTECQNASSTPDSIICAETGTKVISGKTYYRYQLTNITAKDMTETYYAVPYVRNISSGSLTKCGDADKYSILQYCIEMYDYNNDNFHNLLDSVLQYGAAAQMVANPLATRLANEYYALVYLQDATFADGFQYEILQLGELDNDSSVKKEGESLSVETDSYYGVASVCENVEVRFSETTSGIVNITAFRKTDTTRKLSKINISTIPKGCFGKNGDKQHAILNKYTGNEKNIVLAQVYMNQIVADSVVDTSVTLTSIAQSCFENNIKCESVSMPSTLLTIGAYAFKGCSALKTVSLSVSLNNIGSYGFSNCVSLQAIDLPDTLTTINSHLFDGCSSLNSVKLPALLNEINNEAFKNVPSNIKVYYTGTKWETTFKTSFPSGCVLNPTN